MPDVPVSHSLPGPDDIHRGVLDNGIIVLSRPNFNSPSIFISGYLPAGSLLDPDEKLGLADFVSSMLMRGTNTCDFQQIYDSLEGVGASFGYHTGGHTTGFNGRSLAEDLPLLLETLSDTLQNPTFPADHLEKLRSQILTGMAIRAQDTSDMASILFDQLLYDGHPYSRVDEGWPETVQAITREDMLDFHQRAYGPKGMVLAVVGAVEAENALSLVERYLGDWQNEAQGEAFELPEYIRPGKLMRKHYPIPGKSQSDICMGTDGPKRRDPDFMPALLGNNILGQFGMMGRIGEVVREKSGLAYYAYSSLSAGHGPGAWYVSAGVNPSNVEKTVELVTKELKQFAEIGILKDELADSQANYIGRLPLTLESNAGVASALLNIERHSLGMDYYQKYADMVGRVTIDDVRSVAQKYIDPETLVIATAGPE
jgi:zinc protease